MEALRWLFCGLGLPWNYVLWTIYTKPKRHYGMLGVIAQALDLLFQTFIGILINAILLLLLLYLWV